MKNYFNTSFRPFRKYLSINSIQTQKEALYNIPYSISNNYILKQILAVKLQVGLLYKYILRYRLIINIIAFLIRYKPFRPNLVYISMRLYIDKEKQNQIYNKIYTETQWQDIQKTLLAGAIVVSILLISDKTILTYYKGDKSSWSIYITIGNLNKATRRSQQKPLKILLSFLLIIDESDNYRSRVNNLYIFKCIVYNKVIVVLLKRKFYSLEAKKDTTSLVSHHFSSYSLICLPINSIKTPY